MPTAIEAAVGAIALFDGRPVKIVAVDGHAIAFIRKRRRKPRKSDLPGDPVQIVNLTTWNERQEQWKNSFNEVEKSTSGPAKLRRKARQRNPGDALRMRR